LWRTKWKNSTSHWHS